MMMTYEVKLDPITKSKIQLKLFRGVRNVPELRKKIINGQLPCCVIKPTLILHPFQVVAAANKAAIAQKKGHMVTRTVYSETLFNLSMSTNVNRSLPLFGIDDNHTTILVATISEIGNVTHSANVFKEIQGDEILINILPGLTNMKSVRKIYNIRDDEQDLLEIIDDIVNKIVIKD